MYKNKLNKYHNKLKQLGGVKCPYSIGDTVILNTPDRPELHLKSGMVVKIHNLVSEGYWYLQNVCNKIDVEINGIVYNLSSLDVKHLERELVESLPDNGPCNTFHGLTLIQLINLYKSGNPIVQQKISACTFDFYNQPIPYEISLAEFRTIFPLAYGINLNEKMDITDAEFRANILPRPKSGVNSRNVKINAFYCNNLTNNAFRILNGVIHTLDISYCDQITDEAFENLRGIDTLYIIGCPNITNEAFVHLRGINTLYMSNCPQITDAAISNLRGIHTLDISYCPLLTNTAISYLEGIHVLNITRNQNITSDAFQYLHGIETLIMAMCDGITDNGFQHLAGIKILDISLNTNITDAIFIHLNSVINLDAQSCRTTDNALLQLPNIRILNVSNCYEITDIGLSHIRNTIEKLNIQSCYRINGQTLNQLSSLEFLNINYCNRSTQSKAFRIFGVTTGNMEVQYFRP
jgi:hypothetical protein